MTSPPAPPASSAVPTEATARPDPSPARLLRRLLRAELTKARSTRLLWWWVALATLVPPSLAALLGAAMGQHASYCARNTCRNALVEPDETVITVGMLGDGMPGAGLTAATVASAALLLVELRYNTLSTTFVVTSRRGAVAAAKMVFGLAVVVPTALAATLLSGLAFTATAGAAGSRVAPLSATAIEVAARTTWVIALLALMAFGVAALTRNLWVTVATVIGWPTFVEVLLPGLLPGGAEIARWFPVANARAVVGLDAGVDIPWGPAVSAAYLSLLTAAVVAVGVWRLLRADLPRSA